MMQNIETELKNTSLKEISEENKKESLDTTKKYRTNGQME